MAVGTLEGARAAKKGVTLRPPASSAYVPSTASASLVPGQPRCQPKGLPRVVQFSRVHGNTHNGCISTGGMHSDWRQFPFLVPFVWSLLRNTLQYIILDGIKICLSY